MNKRITPYDPELAKSITKEGQRIVRELSQSLEDKISMNERIKELAKQAGIKIAPMIIDGIEYDYENVDMDGSADLSKFAELIVKECIRVPYVMWDKAELNADIAVKIEHRIKEHFGIQE